MELNYALIGMRIKKIRKSKKMTQEKLSELSNISPQHLSQIESAKTKLSLPTLINICNALNVTTDRKEYNYGLNFELREGSQHCRKGTPDFLRETISTAKQLTNKALLFRIDSGNDAAPKHGNSPLER